MPVKTEVLHSCCSDCKSIRAEQKWLCLLLSEEVNKSMHFSLNFLLKDIFGRKVIQFSVQNFSLHLDTPHLFFSPLKKNLVGTLFDLLNQTTWLLSNLYTVQNH